MSFVRLGSTPRFTCVAADAKPTTGIELGSTAYETDTGKLFIFNGAAWVEKTTDVRLTGSNAQEPFGGSSTVAHTFTKAMNGFVISNDGAADLTFTIGTDTFTVKAGEVFKGMFAAFTEVTVTTTVAYRAYGLGA